VVELRSLTSGRLALVPETTSVRRDSEDAFEPQCDPRHARARGLGWSDQGLIDTFEPMVTDARRARLLEVLEGRLTAVTVVMDAPHDPHNGAAVLRTCEALGVQHVHVIPREEEFLAARVVSKGSEQWLDITRHPTASSALKVLKALDYVLIGTHPQGELLPEALREIARVAIVLGNEHAGISKELERAMDARVRVPMRGFVESLNVSVSAAILLAHATAGRSGDLTPYERNSVYARWLLQTVPRSQEIFEALAPR
jgi:tRNA (guanosine-2'-O-)-methyltransferase